MRTSLIALMPLFFTLAIFGCSPDRFHGRDSSSTSIERTTFTYIFVSRVGDYEFRSTITPYSEPVMASQNYQFLQPSIDDYVATSIGVIQEEQNATSVE